MSDETKVQAPEQKPDPNQPKDPYTFLATFPNAPTKAQIELWKQQAPGGRIKMKASGDMKRIYIMRAISGIELAQLQAAVPQNTPPERVPLELENLAVCRCCVWTSVSPDGKLTDQVLKASGSGLADTLHTVISELSDYESPETIERLSVDL